MSSGILTDKKKTAFFFVLIPEKMAILDTEKAGELFAKFQVPLSGYVVNRVLPQEFGTQEIPEFLRNRLSMQKDQIQQIKDKFTTDVLAWVPEFERDITGLPMIKRMADAMFGDGGSV